MKKTLALAAFVLAAPFGLTACGGDDGSATAAEAQFNDADVTFAQQMIPHHQQAVEMAEMAADRAGSPEVRELAEDIEAAQGPEIEQMTQWLEDWGQEVPSGSMDHGDMGHGDDAGGSDGMGGMGGMGGMEGMDGMPGMMDAEEMGRLEDASGAMFDEMWLEMMIEHHEGAVEMARTEQAEGENPDALALAEQIEADQEAEIEKMHQLLGS